jgi:NAD(P)-dependent dehydrogenase (short-subunit alcohol dehydrogenase family)
LNPSASLADMDSLSPGSAHMPGAAIEMNRTRPSGVTPDSEAGFVARAVLITGGTGALGTAVTNRFLEDGHKVVATSMRGSHADATVGSPDHFGDNFHLLRADVTEPESVTELVEQAVATVGTIDVLIHLVGAWGGGQAIHHHSPEMWDGLFNVNLRSAFLCSRAVVPSMRAQGWGRIVLVSSEAARSRRRNQGAYAIAKAGISVLAETIAEENDDVDVTANAVAPSILDTPANRAAMPEADHSSLVPLEDVATTIAFLASAAAGQLRGAWLPALGRA